MGGSALERRGANEMRIGVFTIALSPVRLDDLYARLILVKVERMKRQSVELVLKKVFR